MSRLLCGSRLVHLLPAASCSRVLLPPLVPGEGCQICHSIKVTRDLSCFWALAGIDQAAGGTKGIAMRRKSQEGVWHRIPLPITEGLLSMVHESLLKASEAKQNSGAEYSDPLPDVGRGYVMGDTACLALRVSLSGFGTTTTK